MHSKMKKRLLLIVALVLCSPFGTSHLVVADELKYGCSEPPLEVTFEILGDHYKGTVTCGNLLLEPDIPTAPIIRSKNADTSKLYTLMMLDFDGNANGSWPDPVPSGNNSPVRHWIVGNIPGELLRTKGYVESVGEPTDKTITVLQSYRAPHIPMVSDRYGIYLFAQDKRIEFAPVTGPITNFDQSTFRTSYHLGRPDSSNFFVAIYTSESPFSGKPFHGNDVAKSWHQDLGKGKLTPQD
jgi:phosphatidylethanolamine-binding protein (PEBP) family uncharacterized protein